MPDLVLRDIDPILAERVRRLGLARGWTEQETFVHLLEHALLACEQEVHRGFGTPEVDALADAIAALRLLPAGQGF